MRIISLYVDGIEKAAKQGLFDWIQQEQPDVVCIQNTLSKEYQLPDSIVYPEGYNGYFLDAEQDNYSGVAIYTKAMPKAIMFGLAFEQCDVQGRFIQADFDDFSVGSVCFPKEDAFNSLEDKFAFQQEFLNHLKKTRRKRREFIFCGNFEVAHKTVDLANWREHQDMPGFLAEERAWFDQMLGPAEYVDAFREANFGENQFTWWPDQEAARRNVEGWRLDYQLCTPNLRQFVVDAKVDREHMYSDHAPVIIEYELEDLDD